MNTYQTNTYTSRRDYWDTQRDMKKRGREREREIEWERERDSQHECRRLSIIVTIDTERKGDRQSEMCNIYTYMFIHTDREIIMRIEHRPAALWPACPSPLFAFSWHFYERRKLGHTRIPTAAIARERRYGGEENGWQRWSCSHVNGAKKAAEDRPQVPMQGHNRKFRHAQSSGKHASWALPWCGGIHMDGIPMILLVLVRHSRSVELVGKGFKFRVKFLYPKDTRLFVTNSKGVCHMWQTVLFCDINFLVPCDICDTRSWYTIVFHFSVSIKK